MRNDKSSKSLLSPTGLFEWVCQLDTRKFEIKALITTAVSHFYQFVLWETARFNLKKAPYSVFA